jgi:hypothetical protein
VGLWVLRNLVEEGLCALLLLLLLMLMLMLMLMMLMLMLNLVWMRIRLGGRREVIANDADARLR